MKVQKRVQRNKVRLSQRGRVIPGRTGFTGIWTVSSTVRILRNSEEEGSVNWNEKNK